MRTFGKKVRMFLLVRSEKEQMKELEVYLHIPFCVRKCAYCDFLSGPAGEEERNRYVQALIKEIKSWDQIVTDSMVRSIFFGGGTPSLLNPEQIGRILHTVRRTFPVAEDAEVTMEMNPGTMEKGWMKGYRASGVNRLSIGLQSADNRELAALGRIHTYEQFLDTYQNAREAGFSNINIDLMSAIPGQTMESYVRTLERITALEPEHISAYSLIIEEGTPFWKWYEQEKGKGHPAIPDEETDRKMYEETKIILGKYGYERYEISNYAKPGFACRHNIGYWDRTPYLGFGIGAASLYEEERFSNTEHIEEYMKIWLNGEKTAEEKKKLQRKDWHLLTKAEQEEEFFFLGLRMMNGVSEKEFEEKFRVTPDQIYGAQIREMESKKLLKREKGRIFLTDHGIDVSNYVMAQFLQDETRQEENI